jgi:hypothetical protein
MSPELPERWEIPARNLRKSLPGLPFNKHKNTTMNTPPPHRRLSRRRNPAARTEINQRRLADRGAISLLGGLDKR